MYNLIQGGGPYPVALIDVVELTADEGVVAGQVCKKDPVTGNLVIFDYPTPLTPAAGDEHIPTIIAERNQSAFDVDSAGSMTVLIGNGIFQTDKVDVSVSYAFGDVMVPSTALAGNLMEGTGTFAAHAYQPCVGYYDGKDTFEKGSVSIACHRIIKVLPCGEVYIG